MTDPSRKKDPAAVELSKTYNAAGSYRATDFSNFAEELRTSPHYENLQQRDADSMFSFSDVVAYKLENAIAANPAVRFHILLLISALACAILSGLWTMAHQGEDDTTADWWSAVFMTFQVLVTGGYDGSILNNDERIIFFLMIFAGVVVVSILIGLISDSVAAYMETLEEGTTKVIEKGHTLILGWNEASVRAICQIACIKIVYYNINNSWEKKLMPWKRHKAVTPVASGAIVVMTNKHEKDELTQLVTEAFAEKGFDPKAMLVGREVVFRTGDPTNCHDLVRVSAQTATSILIMMTDADEAEEIETEGAVLNAGTTRTILALRNVVYSNGEEHVDFNPDLRVVVQQIQPTPFLKQASFLAPDGHECMYIADLVKKISSTMFFCSSKPGLSRVFLGLLNFEVAGLRTRVAHAVPAGVSGKVGGLVGMPLGEALLSHHWGNATLVGVDDNILNHPVGLFKGSPGICSDPKRKILSDDHLIFISDTTMPQVSTNAADLIDFSAEGIALLRSDEGQTAKAKVVLNSRALLEEKHMLVAGWRMQWDMDPLRFRARIADMALGLGPGSTVTCMNMKVTESTGDNKAMADICDSKFGWEAVETGGWRLMAIDSQGGFVSDETMPLLMHFPGNPINVPSVQAILSKHTFCSAIIIGSSAVINLPASARDTRVMQMALILRMVAAELGQQMHVIAENALDQTSQIVLGPRAKVGKEPDFVNTQAIIARCLIMNLAYPQIWDSVDELLDSSTTSCSVEFLEASELALVGKTTTFGSIQHYLMGIFHECAVAIGLFDGSALQMNIQLGKKVTWTDKHRVVFIVRRANYNDLDKEEPPAPKVAVKNLTGLKDVDKEELPAPKIAVKNLMGLKDVSSDGKTGSSI